MSPHPESMVGSFFSVWAKGGWIMLPLFALAVFIYYTALDLYLRLHSHSLIRGKAYKSSDRELLTEIKQKSSAFKPYVLINCSSVKQVRQHFVEVRNEYLPLINRRIRFLAIITTAGPLLGLLGTVSGMLATFRGMVRSQNSPLETIVQGVSEALITTQTGLIISIPAMIALSLIIQNRNRLERCIARLEYINVKLVQPAPIY